MEELKVTWTRAAKVWWSLAWRMVVFGTLAGLVMALILWGVLGDAEEIELYSQLLGYLLSVPIGIWVVHTVLTREFGEYRIVLVPSAEKLAERAIREREA